MTINKEMGSGLPAVTVGILSYNSREDLKITISKVLESDYANLEIMVVDNGSIDDSAEMVKSQFPQVKLCKLERNIGAPARNVFFRQAVGKYIILYDDDSMPSTTSTIGEIVGFLEGHSDVASLCTNVINYHNHTSETQGIEEFAVADCGDYYEGPFIHSAGTTYRAECIRQTYGIDEDFFWVEEGDLTLQMIAKNLKMVYKPSIVTYHRVRKLKRDEPWRLLMYTRNVIWLIWKYFPFSVAVPLSFTYLLQPLISALDRKSLTHLLFFLKGVYLGFRGIPTQRRKGKLLDSEAIKKTEKWRQHLVAAYTFRQLIVAVCRKGPAYLLLFLKECIKLFKQRLMK